MKNIEKIAEFSNTIRTKDGRVILKEYYKRWRRQMNTPYSKLTEKEKESDREQARKFIKLIGFTKEQIYFLYEAVTNDIEYLAIKPERNQPKSGKYQYKWDILQELKVLINSYIDWDEPSNSTECVAK